MWNLLRKVRAAAKRILSGPLRIGGGGPGPARVEHEGIDVVCHRVFPESLREAWDALSDANRQVPPFSSFAWQRAVCRRLVPQASLRVITAHHGGSLVAALPLQLYGDGSLKHAGAGVSDYLDPLVEHARQREVWIAVLRALRAWWDARVSQVVLPNLSPECQSPAVLTEIAAESGFVCRREDDEPVMRVALPGSLDEYYLSLEKDARKELRRRLRKAEQEVGACLVDCGTEVGLPAVLERTIGFMEARGGEKSDDVTRYVRPLLLDAIPELFRRKLAHVYTLMLGGSPAGAKVVLTCSRGPLMYNGGFDPAHRSRAPGILANLLVLQQAIADGAVCFDLLRGQEDYKLTMGAIPQPTSRVVLTPA